MPAVIAAVCGARASARTSSRAANGRSRDGRASRTSGSRWRGSARPRPTFERRSGPRAAGTPLRWLALESVDEAAALARLVRRTATDLRLDVLYRLNPDVAPETLAELAVGVGGSKFGMTETEIAEAIEVGGGPDGPLRPRGIHLHVGSQLGAVDAWRDAVRRALAVTALWRGSVETFDTLDVGGGFPVRPLGEPSPTPERFARELPSLLEATPEDRRPTRLAIEPGRALVARAGWLIARVLHVRDRGGRQVILDAGMTELIRPALYGALTRSGRLLGHRRGAIEPTRVEGPICESTDSLGVARPATPSPRRPRRHRGCRRLRRLARVVLQRPAAAPAGPPRARRQRSAWAGDADPSRDARRAASAIVRAVDVRTRFRERLADGPLLADGAMGTLLFSRGIPQRAASTSSSRRGPS